MCLYYITTNKGKFKRVEDLCRIYNIDVIEVNKDIDELEINKVEEVSKDKEQKAYNIVHGPCFVEDSGFYIEGYPGKKDYPGTLVKRSGISTNIEELLEVMKDVENRNCYFASCVTYYDGVEYKQFLSYSKGILSKEKKGILPEKARSRLWEVFIPEGFTKTLAEMTNEERELRNNKTHSAFSQFMTWYVSNKNKNSEKRKKVFAKTKKDDMM